jgi:hypothetical protein
MSSQSPSKSLVAVSRHRHRPAIALAAIFVYATSAYPQDSRMSTEMSAEELYERCVSYRTNPQNEQGSVCAAYVKGFLQATSLLSSSEVEEDQLEKESWTDRAARTRLGARALARASSACDAGEPDVDQFVANLIAYIDANPSAARSTAEQAIEETWLLHYACATASDR